MDPEKGLPAQFDGADEHAVERKKYWNLHHHRQATGNRVDLVLFVELHRLRVQPLRIVLVLLFELVDQRLELLHGLHRLDALRLDRPEENLDADGDEDDRETVARDQSMEKFHTLQERHADHAPEPKLHHFFLP